MFSWHVCAGCGSVIWLLGGRQDPWKGRGRWSRDLGSLGRSDLDQERGCWCPWSPPPEGQRAASLSIQPVWIEHLLYTWHHVGEEGRGAVFLGPLSGRGRQTPARTGVVPGGQQSVLARPAAQTRVWGAPGHPRGSAWERFLEEGEYALTFQTGRVEVAAGEGGGCWAVAAGGAEWQWV